MNQVRIVTDSTVDLPDQLIEELQIEIVPLSITIGESTYTDRVDITARKFMDMMKQTKELPKSSQPSMGQFLEVYNRLTEQGYKNIISIHLSGELSGTIRSAEGAASMSEANVSVVDSRYISLAMGFQVVEAAKMAMANRSVAEILQRLNEIRNASHLYVSVDTLEYLAKGGRIGRGKALVGSLLNIKPIASLSDGVYTPTAKVRSASQVVKFLTKQFIEDTATKKVIGIGIVHADAPDLAERLKESILKEAGIDDLDIPICYTTPIIATHTGPGALGLMYYAE